MDAKIFASLQVRYGTAWMHHRFVTIPEAERMRGTGRCVRFRMARQSMRVYREVPAVEPSKSEETPGAIVAHDVLANVGLARTRDAIRAARLKIRNYPLVRQHDPNFQGA